MPDDHLTFKSTNEEGSATVTRYKLPTLEFEQNKSFPGLIGTSALADDWVAVSLKASQSSSSNMSAERVCLLHFSFNNELHYSDASSSSAGGIGLSPDGRFLAVSGKKGGSSFWNARETVWYNWQKRVRHRSEIRSSWGLEIQRRD
jgi:hypothetical protein